MLWQLTVILTWVRVACFKWWRKYLGLCSGLVKSGQVWSGLVVSGRVWSGLVGTPPPGEEKVLVGSGRVWSGLVGSGRWRCLVRNNQRRHVWGAEGTCHRHWPQAC